MVGEMGAGLPKEESSPAHAGSTDLLGVAAYGACMEKDLRLLDVVSL